MRASVGKGQDSETGRELADRKVTQLQLNARVGKGQEGSRDRAYMNRYVMQLLLRRTVTES